MMKFRNKLWFYNLVIALKCVGIEYTARAV